ncbi:MAG: 7-cyano-7-deazaguanine synthase QueC [Desulfobulbaceae bacterium]|nr:7-cyano-7-deazaguanine synthase QueC [Desulfobulbaceae bacterium]
MREKKQGRAVVLLSGGLDSTTVLAMARQQGYQCYCLSFSYGQRQTIELKRAQENAAFYQAERHLVLELGLDKIGGSALTEDIAVPKNTSVCQDGGAQAGEIPVTYVPGRNTIFLSYAMAWAEVVGAWDIFIGVNAMDYSGYPDCRPEYLHAFGELANLATRVGVLGGGKFVVHAPLLRMTKKEIILAGMALGVDYQKTHSCYDPNLQGLACGACDACQLRQKGFAEAGLLDPLEYQEKRGGSCD